MKGSGFFHHSGNNDDSDSDSDNINFNIQAEYKKDGELKGIISSHDLVDSHNEHTPVSQIMVRDVYTIPQYNDVHQAARLMRNHRIHHVVVTHEQKVVGILSSFDLLALVEDHRFVMKAAPQQSKRQPKRQ